jgi:hypothetical protein
MNNKNKEVLRRGKEQRNFLHVKKRRKVNWIRYRLRKNCLLKHVIEEKIEGTGRRRRSMQLLDDLKGTGR